MDGQARVNVILELKNKLKTGMSQAKSYINKNVSEIKDKISSLRNTHVEAFKEMTDRVPHLGKAMSFLRAPIIGVIALVTTLAAAYGKASAMAHEFEQKMSKVNVTLQENRADSLITQKEVRDIAKRSSMKNAIEAAPDAFNSLVSSGMEKGDALKALETTLNASKATQTDPAIVAKAIASSMNSSGIKDSNRVGDILLATLNKGNAEFADIAQYLPKIIPTAKNVGVTMEETAGAFAYLTAQGQTSERAATLLENAFKVLADPEKVKKFKAIGVSIYDQQGKVKSLTSIVNDLNGALHGLTDEKRTKVLDSLGIDMEAAGAFAAMSQDANKFKDIIDFTVDSQGELNRAMEAAKKPMDSWNTIGNQVNDMWVEVGTHVNESFGKLGEELLPIVEGGLSVIKDILIGVWDVVSYIGGALWSLIKPVVEFVNKSELIKDIWWLIKEVISAVWQVVKTVIDGISWLYEHTLKPIFEAVDRVWSAAKSMIGLGGSSDDPRTAAYREGLANGTVKWEDIVSHMGADAAYKAFPEQAAKKKAYDDNYNNFIKGLKPTTDLYGSGEGGNKQVQDLLKNLLLQDLLKKMKNKDDKEKAGISGGQQTRIININKLSVVDGNFISQNPELAGMNRKEIERWLEEMLQRMLMGLNRSAV